MQIVKGKRHFPGRKFNSVLDMLRHTAKEHGEKDAFIFLKNSRKEQINITFSKYIEDIEAFGTALCELNLDGKHIAIQGENRYEWAVAHTAIIATGGVSVPLDKILPLNETENLLERGDIEAYIFSPKHYCDAVKISEKNKIIKSYICMDSGEIGEGIEHCENINDMHELINAGGMALKKGNRKFLEIKTDPQSPACLIFTSGTSEKPLGVVLSQNNICSNVYGISGVLKTFPGARALSVLPLHHAFENTVGMYVIHYYGATVCFNDRIRYMGQNLVKWKINNIIGVPLLFEILYNRVNEALERKDKKKLIEKLVKISNGLRKVKIDLRRIFFRRILQGFGGELKTVVSGGAAIDPLIVKAFSDWGIEFYQGYGLTETSPVLTTCNSFSNVIGSVGPPIPGVEIAVDAKDGKPGGKGEILARGPNVMMGYYKDEEATAGVFTKSGWFKTGDVGFIDDKGCIHITGRIKSMIVLPSGKKCFPEEIESLLNRIEGVRESMVWGSENQRGGVDIVALIIPENIDKTSQEKSVSLQIAAEIKKINESVPSYKSVKYFFLTEEPIEKTPEFQIRREETKNKAEAKLKKGGISIKNAHMKNIDII